MRRALGVRAVVVGVALGCLAVPATAAAEYAPVDAPGPALTVPQAQLAESLTCTAGVENAAVEPVLLLPATGVNSEDNFSWNYEKALTINPKHMRSIDGLIRLATKAKEWDRLISARRRKVDALEDADGKTIYSYPPEVEGRAISEATAAKLRQILRAVVTYGTGNPAARVPGYTTAGKTGTAQVVENGRYEPGEYVGSFIGYVPADAPRYVIFVKIERPRGAYYGGTVAAPIFSHLASAVMLHSGVMTPPAMLLNSILADLDRFVGNAPQHDDVTCVLMRVV